MKPVLNSRVDTNKFRVLDTEDVHPMGRDYVVTVLRQANGYVFYTYDFQVERYGRVMDIERLTYYQPVEKFYRNVRRLDETG